MRRKLPSARPGGEGRVKRRCGVGKSTALHVELMPPLEHDELPQPERVIAVAGQGSNAEVTVHFAEEGQKRLLLAYAPLKKT